MAPNHCEGFSLSPDFPLLPHRDHISCSRPRKCSKKKKRPSRPSTGISYYYARSLLSVCAARLQYKNFKRNRNEKRTEKINKPVLEFLQKVVFFSSFSCVILWWRTRKQQEISEERGWNFFPSFSRGFDYDKFFFSGKKTKKNSIKRRKKRWNARRFLGIGKKLHLRQSQAENRGDNWISSSRWAPLESSESLSSILALTVTRAPESWSQPKHPGRVKKSHSTLGIFEFKLYTKRRRNETRGLERVFFTIHTW